MSEKTKTSETSFDLKAMPEMVAIFKHKKATGFFGMLVIGHQTVTPKWVQQGCLRRRPFRNLGGSLGAEGTWCSGFDGFFELLSYLLTKFV